MAKGKTLSGEDRILWGKVARTTRPLPGRMEELAEFEEPKGGWDAFDGFPVPYPVAKPA